MQVCQNGHQITAAAATMPQFRKAYCPECGAETIDACPECGAPIDGYFKGALLIADIPVPNNCAGCGAAYPWRQVSIASAIEVLEMEIGGEDAASVHDLVTDIVSDIPQTQLAALKLQRILKRLSKPAYDIAIGIISDLGSETAKKIFGLK